VDVVVGADGTDVVDLPPIKLERAAAAPPP
jgi:hypothetical protein